MLKMLLVSFVVFGIFMAAMAVGVIFSNKRLKGSCGGLNKVMGDDCDFCEKKDQCPSEKKATCDGSNAVYLDVKANEEVHLKSVLMS